MTKSLLLFFLSFVVMTAACVWAQSMPGLLRPGLVYIGGLCAWLWILNIANTEES
ncbi:MAG: hypothetical protein WAK55_17450 [Xanthobacteraceae bacterium]